MALNFLRLVIPSVFSTFALMLQEIVNLIFVGHLHSASKIAAVGIGNAIQNILGISIIIGMNGALNTLVSQAAGACNIDLCLMYLKRCKIVMSLCFIPITILILFSEHLLLLIGQIPEVSRYAHQYNLVFLPAIYL